MLIKLLKPHTHAGRDYPPGARLDMHQTDAEWLIAIGVAEPAHPDVKPAPQPTPRKPTEK